MGVGLLVGVWVARYLGPENYGLLNYALAFTGLFGALTTLGLPGIVVRDIVSAPGDANRILGTAFVLRFIGGLISFCVIIGTIGYLRPEDGLTKIIIVILGFILIIQSFEVIKWWFESQVQSKFVVWIENGVFLVIAALKVWMILMQANLIAFVVAIFAEAFCVSLILTIFYKNKVGKLSVWKPNLSTAKRLLSDSWPLILSGFAIAVYMKIDQIMLGQMLGDKAVGIYSAAVRISEVWYFVPGVIVTSVFPSIIIAKKSGEALYYQRLQKLYDLMIWIAIFVAVAMSFLSDSIVNFLFGLDYIEAGGVLKIHIWAGINVALGTAWSNWIVIENKQKLVLIGHILGSALNIVLNLFLIKIYGIKGAALATLFGYWISALFVYSLFKPEKSYGLFIRSFDLIRIINGIKRK